MRNYTIQVDVEIVDDPDFNYHAIEDQLLAYIHSVPILRSDILAIRSKVTPTEERESIDTGPSKTGVPNAISVTINDIVRAVRSGAHDSLRYALEAFYLQCIVAHHPQSKPDSEIDGLSKTRTRLYGAVLPLLNKRFKDRNGYPSRFFNTWTTPISVFLETQSDVSDSTATCEDVWEFVREAIAQEFQIKIEDGHPLYRYSSHWTLGTIAKFLNE